MEDWFLERQGHPGTRYHLNILLGTKDKLMIGRKAGGAVDIVCNGKTVSREHCTLQYDDSFWKVRDLGSMNGVYVNRSRIPENSPTVLRNGDMLGVGAVDTSDPDYFVFDVCKTVIKDENQNNKNLTEGPDVSHGTQSAASLSNGRLSSSRRDEELQIPSDMEQTNCYEECFQPFQTDHQEITPEHDPKLYSECVVRLERLPPITHSFVQAGMSRNRKKVLVTGKKRVHQYVEDSDSDSDNLNDTIRPRVPVVRIHTDILKEPVNESSTKILEDRRKLSDAPQRSEDVPCIKIGNDGSDDICEILVPNPLVSTTHADNFYNGEIIYLSSDEETFSVPRFPLDDFPEPSTLNQDQELISEPSSSSDSDGPVFPELSQTFLDEIAEEEEKERNTELKTSNEVGERDKLESLVESKRLEPKQNSVRCISPLPLQPHQSGGRFSLNTGRGRHVETPNLTADKEPAQSKNFKNSKVQCHRVQPTQPHREMKGKKRTAKTLRIKFKSDYGLEGRGTSSANRRITGIIHPADPTPRASSSKQTTGSCQKNIAANSQVKKSSEVPVRKGPVKVKNTGNTRSALFVEDVVGKPSDSASNENQSAEGSSNSAQDSGLKLKYVIPKIAGQTEGAGSSENSSSSNPATAQKRRLSDDENIVDEDALAGAKSLSFKEPKMRRSRLNSDTEREIKKKKSFTNKYDDSRNAAIPLGSSHKKSAYTAQPFRNRVNSNSGTASGSEKVNSIAGPTSGSALEEECVENIRPSTSPSLDNPSPHSNQGSVKSGILRVTAREFHLPKKKVCFSTENVIHLIPARSPKLKIKHPPRTFIQPINVQSIMDEIYLRICNWNFNWIQEQKQIKDDEPPPLLNEITSENQVVLSRLSLLPVVSSYENLQAYHAIFHPLMLHEIWANICKDVETASQAWRIKIHGEPLFNGSGCAVLKCETFVLGQSPRFKEFDLLGFVVPLPKPKQPIEVFAIAENIEFRFVNNKSDIDRRILSLSDSTREVFRINFDLRVKPSNIPRQLDKIFTLKSASSLRPVIKQFLVNANLWSSPLCEVILNPSSQGDAFQLDLVDVDGNGRLNPVQHKAVESISRSILNTDEDVPKVALLQGPPGTGKSHVIVELVIRMIFMHYEKKNSWPRILICAPSNNAIDEIAIRLQEARDRIKRKFQIVRIGVSAAMNRGVRAISLDYLADLTHRENISCKPSPESQKIRTLEEEVKNLTLNKRTLINAIDSANREGNAALALVNGRKLTELEDRIDKISKNLEESKKAHHRFFSRDRDSAKLQVVGQANVICSTLNSCRGREMDSLFLNQNKQKFLCCIIDEASQCTEPESLTPLVFGINKLVMIGDPDQLPATVASHVAQKNRFDQSLFNRFFSSRMTVSGESYEPVLMLDTQYRMARPICEWPSKYFYGGKLKTAENLLRDGPCHHYRVLNVLDGQEKFDEVDGRSIMNEQEATLIASIVRAISCSPEARNKRIGVITFYQKQKQAIIQALKNSKDIASVEVNTVDSFQGREMDIVIVSCVRAQNNRGGEIGFLGSLQRMNVALTRAKESLIICGHFPTLLKNEAWNDLIKDAYARKAAHVVSSSHTLSTLKHLIFR